MSTELIVVRAFMGDRAVAEELLAHGFAPELMPTREGGKVAQTLLELRAAGTVCTPENLWQALCERGNTSPRLRRYLKGLQGASRCPRLHAVAHLQMLKLDAAMSRVDRVCAAIGDNGGTAGRTGEADGAAPKRAGNVSPAV